MIKGQTINSNPKSQYLHDFHIIWTIIVSHSAHNLYVLLCLKVYKQEWTID